MKLVKEGQQGICINSIHQDPLPMIGRQERIMVGGKRAFGVRLTLPHIRYRSARAISVLRSPQFLFVHFQSCVILWIYVLIFHIFPSDDFTPCNHLSLILNLFSILHPIFVLTRYFQTFPYSVLILMYNLHSPPLSAASSTSSPPPECVEARKPNILFILADQVSAPLLRIHNDKSPIKTPNIDALAAKSAVFSSAYCASPLCAPSRSSLVTGQLPSQIGAWDNASPLGCDAPTYAHYLRRDGYETVLAGKMHFIGEQLHGYEERLTSDIYPGDFGWYVQCT